MKKYTLYIIIIAAWLTNACSQKHEVPATDILAAADTLNVNPDDSTLYGLACDGCTDTIVVVLSDIDSDPDTFDILNASRNHQVFGHPRIGDKLAVVLNAENPKVADRVIDLEKLQGGWCYMVMPELRQRAGMPETATATAAPPDSLLKQLMQPREYGFEIKSNNTARPIGISLSAATSDEQSPVVYPRLKRYRSWYICNGLLVLTENRRDTLGSTQIISSDTADFVFMRRDSLVLRFNDHEQSYYRQRQPESGPKQ